MVEIPEGIFASNENYHLGKKILRKMAMNLHDQSNPASLSDIKNYLAKGHPNGRLLQIMSTMIGSDIPINGQTRERTFWLEDKMLNGPFFTS